MAERKKIWDTPSLTAQLFRRISFKSLKATISFLIFVRPSVSMYQLGPPLDEFS